MQDVLIDDQEREITTALVVLRERYPHFSPSSPSVNGEGTIVAATLEGRCRTGINLRNPTIWVHAKERLIRAMSAGPRCRAMCL